MKVTKKVVTISLVVLFIGVAAFNVHMNAEQNQSLNQSSKVTLQNIAALTAVAEESDDDCWDWGYKTWNYWASFKDGVDCDCGDREKVKDPCANF